jgi:uncharacterized protein
MCRSAPYFNSRCPHDVCLSRGLALTTDTIDAQSRSRLLIEHDFALMKQLANVRLYSIRLYVHLPEGHTNPGALRREISDRIRTDLPNFPFSD